MFGFGGPRRPKVVAFDVIGTVFPLESLRPAITALSLPPAALEGWFAAGLRDAFALSAIGDFAPLPAVLDAALDQVLAEHGLRASRAGKAAVLDGMKRLAPRPDARQAFTTVVDAGLRVMAVSNGARAATQALLDRGRLDDLVSHVVSVDDVRLFKPRPEVYEHAARVASVRPRRLALVAVHGWDINGARAAGLVTAYVSAERPFPRTMRQPDVQAPTLAATARRLAAL